MKKILSLFFIIFIFGALLFVAYKLSGKATSATNMGETPKLKVTTSFYPLYYLATEIGGPLIKVTNITPAGAEPHDYEITNQDIYNIKSSNLLILTGNLETWAQKITANLVGSEVKVLEVGSVASDKNDPHFWLSPKEFALAADKITQSLLILDPTNKDTYLNNAQVLNKKLLGLDAKLKTELTTCQTRDLVTSHDAFGYLAREYGLRQLSIAGISTEEEPSLKKLAEVAQFARQNDIKYIFFESLLSPKLSETIAREVGAKTMVLNPLEGLTTSEISAGFDYISIMEDNLANLKIALQCQ
jgi:zinc transport system substrate-binding protein